MMKTLGIAVKMVVPAIVGTLVSEIAGPEAGCVAQIATRTAIVFLGKKLSKRRRVRETHQQSKNDSNQS